MKMAENQLAPEDELKFLKDLNRSLMREKADLLMVSHLMNTLTPLSGIEAITRQILQIMAGMLSGNNVLLYYLTGNGWKSIDLHNFENLSPFPEDPLVARAINSGETIDVGKDLVPDASSLSNLNAGFFLNASRIDTAGEKNNDATNGLTKKDMNNSSVMSMAIPLKIRNEVIGVIKFEDMLINYASLTPQIENISGYLALLLKSELSNAAELERANARLLQRNDELAQAQKSLKFIQHSIDSIADSIFWVDESAAISFVNDAACKNLGYSRDELLGMSVFDFDPMFPREKWTSHWQELAGAGNMVFETVHITRDGKRLSIEITATYVEYQGHKYNCAVARDITERKMAETEHQNLQAQLIQAQKMESIGRLAGGVAHDFNNMLSIILGNSEMIMEKAGPESPFTANLNEIRNAAERSTNLTRQLLAFARKQTVIPKIINLNKTVSLMTAMLSRLIGENIQLAWKPSENLWLIKMDPSQIDQILVNLCINSRDAIADVGRITIETENKVFDRAYCHEHADFLPGDYVLLSVCDNGCGMDRETREKMFDPFFTTKAIGEGTGLGLATVYGIVKQNNGFINVYSEPGLSTVIRIYLPRYISCNEVVETTIPDKPAPRGNETILVVEDEPAILTMVKKMLTGLGYTVLPAATPEEAMTLTRNHNQIIHLLITDVVMPEMNGRDLAAELTALQPELKILFMSGYTANVIASHGVLNEGVQFIQKPFSKKSLALEVRRILADG
ncbi:MAG: hypothetical protein CVV64_16740 [Candidatus Wallbacteria bacterium HGW-Wallbacteria-1]|jgi:PAS domain S-box-containing protein|uniref:histidine kinase n=1 Tax=Candidatus Wallbacteria bacterium HGW-Wallbacteria-1 TaxID=2013854 RepID=A0A2N1PKN7_9BACT|nr:MAG: hypothetical protein CVV64_16740 [Candidatus Wallbacteria bacterium HGW-Wallbacteria-1]